jgi:hypothetical protein
MPMRSVIQPQRLDHPPYVPTETVPSGGAALWGRTYPKFALGSQGGLAA